MPAAWEVVPRSKLPPLDHREAEHRRHADERQGERRGCEMSPHDAANTSDDHGSQRHQRRNAEAMGLAPAERRAQHLCRADYRQDERRSGGTISSAGNGSVAVGVGRRPVRRSPAAAPAVLTKGGSPSSASATARSRYLKMNLATGAASGTKGTSRAGCLQRMRYAPRLRVDVALMPSERPRGQTRERTLAHRQLDPHTELRGKQLGWQRSVSALVGLLQLFSWESDTFSMDYKQGPLNPGPQPSPVRFGR